MNEVYEKLLKCYACFEDKIDFKPQAALILGSGLGDYADTNMKVEAVLDYHDIEGFPVSTVPGHKGRFVFGYVGDVPVVCRDVCIITKVIPCRMLCCQQD